MLRSSGVFFVGDVPLPRVAGSRGGKFCGKNEYVNLLKPTGHVMDQQFNIQQLYVLPTHCAVPLQMNGAVSKVNKKFISHLTRAKRTPSAAATVQVSHALPAVRFSCLLRGRGASLQDGAAARKGFLCAPF